MGRIVTGRQDVTSIKDARRVVYPRGLALQALETPPAKLPPPIVFRSRLEADWANTLDQLRIRWSYEPELFTLPNGAQYLPDFYLPELSTWLEVKGPALPWHRDPLRPGTVPGLSPLPMGDRGHGMPRLHGGHSRGQLLPAPRRAISSRSMVG